MADSTQRNGRIWSSRRLWFAISTLATASTLVWFGKIEGAAWAGVIGSLIVGYYGNRAITDRQ